MKFESEYHKKWIRMHRRCGYNHGYIDCTIHPEWYDFNNFKKWMEYQDWAGKELDKDLLVPGNREYSAEKCCFLPKVWNNTFRKPFKLKYFELPIGVIYDKNVFRSQISMNGEVIYLGTRATPLEAHVLWQKAMIHKILDFAATQYDPINSALLFRADRIQSHIDLGIETTEI